ncbi:hypothetical protein [Kitasatospora sp. NPDC101183]|uniref:hypothetical protein n=1 Tax=Kitasatospora sp. NPDC101183 TaxID=3364100 RepID=UPI003804516E
MANDQTETPAPTAPHNGTTAAVPAAAAEAVKTVEGAVAATSNPAGYTPPTAEQKAALENGEFGDEVDHIVEQATDEPGKPYGPQDLIAGHP